VEAEGYSSVDLTAKPDQNVHPEKIIKPEKPAMVTNIGYEVSDMSSVGTRID